MVEPSWRKVEGAVGRCWAWVEGMETCAGDLNDRGQCSRCLEWYRAHDMFAPGSGPERPTETARLVEVLERIAGALERLEARAKGEA